MTFAPMASLGIYGLSTLGLDPTDIRYVGGKAAHTGILREALPANSPVSMAFTFDVWNAFLDQTLTSPEHLIIQPGGYLLLWADNDPEQGPTHLGFRLNRKGESITLLDANGTTLLDTITFSEQETDVSFGRSVEDGESWQAFAVPTPGAANGGGPQPDVQGLVINEFMADNKTALEDPCDAGTHPDWIELYNGTDNPVVLNGMFLSDDANKPTRWRTPVTSTGQTLGQEIAQRLASYQTLSASGFAGPIHRPGLDTQSLHRLWHHNVLERTSGGSARAVGGSQHGLQSPGQVAFPQLDQRGRQRRLRGRRSLR